MGDGEDQGGVAREEKLVRIYCTKKIKQPINIAKKKVILAGVCYHPHNILHVFTCSLIITFSHVCIFK